MDKPDIPGALLEQWLSELGIEPDQHGFEPHYGEGWKSALTMVLIRYDEWRHKSRAPGQRSQK